MKPKFIPSFLLTFLCLVTTVDLLAQRTVPEKDSLALVDLYNSAGGSSWTAHGWLQGRVSGWEGVYIQSGRVTQLNLSKYNLNGSIPTSIGNLDALVYLNLSYNTFNYTSIPTSIGNLVNLTQLRLNGSKLGGSLPASIGNLKKLVYLYVQGNQLDGLIPVSIKDLKDLTYVDFTQNKFGFKNLDIIQQIRESNPKLKNLILGRQLTVTILKDNIWLSAKTSSPASINNYTWIINPPGQNTTWAKTMGDSVFVPFFSGKYAVEIKINHVVDHTFYSAEVSWTKPAYSRANDSCALVDLYRRADGSHWKSPNGWLTGPISSWSGVTITNNRVTALNLQNKGLIGTIGGSLNYLQELNFLDLSHNKLDTTEKYALWNLPKLKTLRLNNNQLKQLGDFYLPALDSLTLSNNRFTFKGLDEANIANYPFAIYAPQAPIIITLAGNTLYGPDDLGSKRHYWFKDDQQIAYTRVPSYQPTANGVYFLKVITEIPEFKKLVLVSNKIVIAGLALPGGRIINNSKNINASETESVTIAAYPNPVRDNVTVTLKTEGKYSIQLSDISGRTLAVKSGTTAKGTTNIVFNLNGYAPGLYQLTLVDAKGKMHTIKLVK